MFAHSWMFLTSSELLSFQQCGLVSDDDGSANCGWEKKSQDVTDKTYTLTYQRNLDWTSTPVYITSDYWYAVTLALDDQIDTSETATFHRMNLLFGGASTLAAATTALAATLMF